MVSSSDVAVIWQHSDHARLQVSLPPSISVCARNMRLSRALAKHLQEATSPAAAVSDVESPGEEQASMDFPVYPTHQLGIVHYAPGMEVEVAQVDDGLVGSTYAAKILEVRREYKNKRKISEALVEYEALLDERDSEVGLCSDFLGPTSPASKKQRHRCGACGRIGHKAPTCTTQSSKLREWVKISSLAPRREPPPEDWHKTLRAGEEAELMHADGYWRVLVLEGKDSRFKVQAVGYEPPIIHNVGAESLRPVERTEAYDPISCAEFLVINASNKHDEATPANTKSTHESGKE